MSGGTNNGVAGVPPGHGDIPRGIELLVKKASVDAEFRALQLERRAEAADASYYAAGLRRRAAISAPRLETRRRTVAGSGMAVN